MPLCPILFSNTFAFYCAFTHIPFLNSSSQPSRFPIRTSYSIYIYYLLVPIESFIFVKRINDYLSVAIANFLVIEPFERSYDLMIWLENLGVCIRLYTLCIYIYIWIFRHTLKLFDAAFESSIGYCSLVCIQWKS